jgi:hypothetical protein
VSDRDALRGEVSRIADRDLPLLTGAIRAMTGSEIESVEELPGAGREFRERLEEFEERLDKVERRLDRLGDVGQEPTSKEEKFAAILAFAENKHNGSAKVALSPQEVRGYTGVSRRYAYDLIDEMADVVAGVEVREATDVKTGSGTEHKGKALLVDCEAVHHNGGGVNEFTTGGGATEGA